MIFHPYFKRSPSPTSDREESWSTKETESLKAIEDNITKELDLNKLKEQQLQYPLASFSSIFSPLSFSESEDLNEGQQNSLLSSSSLPQYKSSSTTASPIKREINSEDVKREATTSDSSGLQLTFSVPCLDPETGYPKNCLLVKSKRT